MTLLAPAVNDFVVKFANVNGSGSASANELFARSILRMGVPVSPRNIFPSNIQGMPTWYEVRVSEAGYLGRRGGCDLMVAMNPQTFAEDIAEIVPGGFLFYDSSKPLYPGSVPDSVNRIGLPLTALCTENWQDPRQRQLLKNIVYVGALAALLDIELAVIDTLLGEQYRGKEKLLGANQQALRLGHDAIHAQQAATDFPLKVRRADKVGNRIFVDGNSAAALGCLYGGASVCAWYPITPSTSVVDAFQKYCSKYRTDPNTGERSYAIIQAEDEIASIGMVIGAGWNGARAFTATSGPGISLMTEFIGLAYFAEIPATIINIQRGGPSTGMPTRTQQADLYACAYASNGDTKHVLLFPEDPKECFDFAAAALDLADQLQTPVFVLSDLDIGMNTRLCEPLAWQPGRQLQRGKIMTAAELEAGKTFGRYLDVDGDGIPYRTLPGTHPSKGAYFSRGTTKDRFARYSEKGSDYVDNMERLLRKFETAKALVPAPVEQPASTATSVGVLYFGSTSPAMTEARDLLQAQGLFVDLLRLRAFPFPDSVLAFIKRHRQVFVIEQNRDGQLRNMLVTECEIDPAVLQSIRHYDGTPITANFIADQLRTRLAPEKNQSAAHPLSNARQVAP